MTRSRPESENPPTDRPEAAQSPRAYSYLRFSTPEQAKGDSRRRQTAAAEAYARAQGLILDDTLRLSDEGLSGFSGANVRKGALGQFLRAVDDGLVPEGSYLLVESLDRVSRQNPWDAFPIFQQIINAGVILVTLQDGKVYTREDMRSNPLKILESLFVMIRANEESETKSRRLRSVWQQKRDQASQAAQAEPPKPLTAKAPAWLTLDRIARTFTIIPERAAVVRRIFDMYVSGNGQHRICELLNRESVPVFGTGQHWQRSYIQKILTNPAVIGTFVPHDVTFSQGKRRRSAKAPIPNYFPAVVPLDLYEKAQSQRTDTAAPRQHTTTLANIVGGLAKCASCGSTMTRISKGSRTRSGKPYLICTRAKTGAGCSYHVVPLAPIEETLRREASAIVGTAPSGNTEAEEALERIDAALMGVEEQIERILDAIQYGSTSYRTTRLAELESTAATLKSEREEHSATAAATTPEALSKRLAELEQALSEGTVAEANAALRRVLKHIEVEPTQGSMALGWKQGGYTSLMFAWPKSA